MLGSAIDDGLILSGAACWIGDKMKTSGVAASAIDDEVTVSGSVIDEVLNMSGGPSDGTARSALAAQRARAKNQKRNERRKAAWQREHAQQLKEVRFSYRLCRLATTARRTSTSEICVPHRRRRSR